MSLGGEQSGHVVMLEHASTGDGLLTALHLLAAVAASGSSLATLGGVVQRLPQVLDQRAVADRDAALERGGGGRSRRSRRELGDDGRVLVRASGTEPLVRVMVEAPTQAQAIELAERIAAVIGLGASAGQSRGGTLARMCGIVGYVGTQPALDVVVGGLKRLEYRGYDSAGIAIRDDDWRPHRRTSGRQARQPAERARRGRR